jgi:hypothetical protein
MTNPTRCALLAFAFGLLAVPAAKAEWYDDAYMEPHHLIKARYENSYERRHFPAGYDRYQPRDGRYPGHIYYRRPAPDGREAADYSLSYSYPSSGRRPAYQYRRAYVGPPYYVRERTSELRTRPAYRGGDSTPSRSGYGLSTRQR